MSEQAKETMNEGSIRAGDVVRYARDRIGGGTMRVESVTDGYAICTWQTEGREGWSQIPTDILCKVEAEQAEQESERLDARTMRRAVVPSDGGGVRVMLAEAEDWRRYGAAALHRAKRAPWTMLWRGPDTPPRSGPALAFAE